MKKLYTFFVLFVLKSSLLQNGFAQISKGGTPASFNYQTLTSTFDVKSILPIDVKAAAQEDSARPGPYWAGRSIPLSYDMTNSGTWTVLPDGNKIWRLKLTSSGAKGLAVVYDNFYLPEGGKLFLYNEAKTQIIGAYTNENNPANGIFSTELIQGESLTLEYIAPFHPKTKPLNQINGTINGNKISTDLNILINTKNPSISISALVYLYYDTPILSRFDPAKATGFGTSLACEVNVNCSEGTNWQTEKKGVAEIWLQSGGSWGWCTGSLINTTNNSGTPYFLTADHCHSEGGVTATAAEMLTWQFYFKYEGAGCPDPGAEPAYSTLTGCALKAASPINGGSDFCLVLLGTTPPQSYNPYYNGWDRTNSGATSGVGIHHPSGDIKKISTFSSTLTSGTWNDGTNVGAAGAHWQGSFITTANGYGQTEGGSSGSPIFNQNRRVTGTLSGGTAADCATGSSFDYGKLWYHWDQTPGGTATQLKTWLDPVNAGSTVVNGYDPYAGYPDFYGTPTTVYEGGTVNFTDITNSATSWAWQFEGGSPATSTAQNPTNIIYYQQGTYRVSLTTFTAIAGTQTIEKVAYITVLPGQPPAQIWCDDFSTPANWSIINHSGVANQVWAITTAAPVGSFSATNPGKLNSTSGGNYALFDTDGLTTTNVEQWSSISCNVGVNCTNYESVILKFEEAYTKYYDSTLVYVSTDDFATSTRYVVNANYSNNDASQNPENVSLDISSAAAGNTNVKVRFTFRSTPSNMGANAGWGYAWGIDDVCMVGVQPGYSLPIPEFIATTTKRISPGQSVSYQDQSQYSTSWLWTFEGGTPASSTLQNPTGIVYNAQGYYAVTLTATNSNGDVSTTKTDYIHVFYDCSYDSNIEDADDASYSRVNSPSWGFAPGHNNTGVSMYADKFTIGNLTGKVKSLIVGVGVADIIGGTTNVTFTIWNDNAGIPGSVLSTRVVAVKDLLAGYLNTVEFSPTAVGSTFWAGFQLTNVANLDTFVCYIASGSPNRTNTASCYNGSAWVTYEAQYGINGSLYLMPEFCLDKPSTNLPDVDFYASQTEIAPGTAINFFNQSTGGPASSSWSWTLTGGTPNNSTSQNPSAINYAASGLYDVTHTSTNTNGVGTKTKVGYIHVAPTSNIVFWNFPSNPDNAIADGGIAANTAATITNWGAPTAQSYGTAGATTRCASTTKWDDANATPSIAWSVTFSTAGYTNIKFSSKQAAGSTSSPRDFAIYYAVNGGDYNYLTSVNPLTTAGNWTQGVVSNIQMPAECDNQSSIEVVWYKTSDISANGGTVTATATSLIDDIYITGQACSTLPAGAGTITGSATVCQGSSGNVYTVPTITGATIYNWTVPTGATITAGNYTNSMTVTFAQNQTASNITVYGENMCGQGTISPNKAVSFTPVPATPGPMTGNQSVLNGQTGIVYSVPAVAGATSYSWTVPAFATITSGGTSNSATVSIACPGSYGNFTVHANNACGAGPESYAYTVGVTCNSPTADFMADNTNILAGSTVNFTDLSLNSPSSWSWSFSGGTPATSTLKNPSVLYSTAGVYDVTLTATNALGNNVMTKTGYIIVTPAPLTLVTWNFPNNPDNATADGGIAANTAKTISTQGGATVPTYATAGAATRCANATNWATGSGTKFWQIEFTTTGYQDINVSSKMTGNNGASPRDFKLQYKIGAGGTWTDFTGGAITLSLNNWTNPAANLSALSLPAAINNQASVYLSWVMTSNTSISNGVINNSRSCYIDDIIVIGTPLSPPVANFSGTPTTVCAGQSVAFIDASTNSPSSWSWTFAGGTPATSTSQNPTVTYSTAGTYNVGLTATNAGGSNLKTLTNYITVNAVPATPTITAGGPTTFCTGGSVTLTSSSGTGYLWSTGATTASINVTTGGSYSVQVTNASGCQSAASISTVVTVNALPATPTITSGGSTTFCTGGSVSLTSSAGTSYLWSTGATTSSINATTAGSYSVQVTNASGCQSASSAATVVTVNTVPATPTISVGGPTTFCAGGSVTLTSSAGTSYLWSTGATTASINAITSGNYSVQVTNAGGCQSAASAATSVTVNALPATPTITAGGPTTFCTGGSVTLTSSAGTSYLWSTGATTASVNVSSGGSYSVQVTNASGCQSAASISTVVTVNALPATPTITAGGSTTFCSGGSVSLTSSAGTGYLWSTGATTSSINVTTSGSYTVQVTNASGCQSTSSASTVVTVNALPATPTINAGGSTTFCTGGSVLLTSSAGTSYLWSNGATTANISATTSGNYTVQVTNSSGCQSAASSAIVVTVNALPATPTISAGGPTSFCTGGSVTLTSSAGTSYLWSTGETSSGINITTAGSYTVRVTNASGCQSAVSVATVVTVNALPTTPTITAGGSTTFCTGGSVTLTSSAGTNYLWSTGATTASINATTAGTYTVQITNASGCQSAPSAGTLVTVNGSPATPTITAGGPISFCTGGSVTLTSSAGTSYLWSTGATTASIDVSTSGSYSAQVTNAGGCQSAASAATIVTVNALPSTPTITAGGPTTFCTGGSVILTSSAGTSYLWSTGATTASINVTTAGSYSVQVTNAGCQSAASVSTVVTVNSLPSTPTISAGGSTTFCSGGSVTLSSSAGTSYLWSNGATTASIIATLAGNYTVQVTNSSGCQSPASATTVVTVNASPPTPTISAGGPTSFCTGGSVTLTSSAGTNYLWSTGATTASIDVSTSGSYTVQVTNAGGCQSAASAATIVTVNALPATPTITAGGPTTFCTGGSVILTSSAGTSYLWSTGATTASINVTIAGSYSVQVTNAGCQSAVSVSTVVTVNSLPPAPTISAGGSTTFCSGGSVTLSSSAGTSYLWSNGATTTSISATLAGNYTVQVTNSSGCQSLSSAPTAVTVNALPATPTITAGGPTNFCSGGIVTLTSSPGTSYLWSSGETTASINASSAGSYSVQITNTSGCQSAASVATSVVVNALPSTPAITAGGPTNFCPGGNVTLSSSSGTSYLWSNGATTASINASTAGSYTVQVTNVNGCLSAASASMVVTENALPTLPIITANGSTTICAGGNVTLSSSAGVSYLWSTGATTSSIIISSAGSYSVQVTNAEGCQSSASAATSVIVNSLPVVNAGIDATIPNGTSTSINATVSGTGPFNYSWSPAVFLIDALTEDPTSVNLSSTTIFTLTATSTATTCSNSDAVTITISGGALSSTPSATPNTVCAGSNVQLDALAGGGSGSYTYSWTSAPAGFTSSIGNPIANPTVNTTYSVAVFDGFSTVNSGIAVAVNALPATPTITAGGPITFCTGGSVSLTSSAGINYLWSTGETTASIIVSTGGSYSVQVTNASGCQSASSAAIAVTVNPLPATPTITAGGPTDLCTGGSVTLTSSPGTSYLWSTGATTSGISPTNTGSYSVQVTNSSGCQSAASSPIQVTVNPIPSTPAITTGGPTTFCADDSVMLTSSAGTTYSWSTGATTQSIFATIAGTYSVQVTNSSGCQSATSAGTDVSVNPLPSAPTITAGGPTSFCTGGNVTLTSSAGTSYLWSDGSTTASINVSISGSYSVQITNISGCLSTASVVTQVTENSFPATPTITAGGPTAFCDGDSVSLTSSNGTSYLWSTGATTSGINVTTAGSYSVQVTNAGGCQSASSVATGVTVNSLPATPTVTAGGPTTFCAGGSVTLTSGSGISYLWSNGETTSSINASAAGSYTVKITNASGCQSASSIAIVVTLDPLPAIPTISAGGPTDFCDGGNVLLTSSAGTGYLWSDGSTTASINITTTGSYTVQVTDAAGCQSTSSAATAVTVNSFPSTPTITAGGPTTFCMGDSVTLTSSSGTTYLWSDGTTSQSNTVTVGGSYSVQVANSGGCQSVASVALVVTVNSLPATPAITAGSATTFCDGGSVTLTSDAGTSYLWSTGATSASINPTSAGNYSVQVTNSSGCLSAASPAIVVTVDALPATPIITAGGPTDFCTGGSVTLTSSSGTSYLWSDGATAASINVSSAGSYSVQVTNAGGCQSIASAATVVTVNAIPPTPTITAGGPTTFCTGDNVTLTSSPGTNYLWSDGSISQSNTVTNGGSYTVQVANSGGCQSAASVATVVTVNSLPSTPIISADGPTDFCTGESVNLTSTAGVNYLWTDGSTTATINVSNAGNYSVQVTNTDGCQSAASAITVVSVNAIPATPTITPSSPTDFCSGDNVTLTASFGSGYLWSDGATTASINVSNSGNYSVQVTNAGGCQSASSLATIVTVNSLPATPIITAGGPTSFCTGGVVTLSSSAGTGYLWSDGTTTASINVTTGGSYSVQVTNAGGCMSPASVAMDVTVNAIPALPTITAGGPTTFCTGGSVTLTSSPGASYLWSNGSTAASINVTTAGNYYVQVTNSSGCQSAASATIITTENSTPSTPFITAGGPITFCSGDSVTLTSSSEAGYLWSNGSTSQSIYVSNSGIYTVQVTNAGGCQSAASAAIVITVNALPLTPTITAGGPTAFCDGGNVTLTSSSETAYLWSDGSTTAGINVTSSGSYSVQVTNANGCQSASSVASDVTVISLPATPTILPQGPTSFCPGDSVTLTASPETSYLWSDGETTASIVVSNAGSYTVQVTNASGCQSSSSVATEVTVYSLPAVPNITAGGPTTFCTGGTVTLTSDAGAGYLWSNGLTSQSIIVTTTGNYAVQVISVNGCQSAISAATTISVNSLPLADAGPDQPVCIGQSVTLTATGGNSYLWNTSEITSSITVNPVSNNSYSVTVTDGNGCQSEDSVSVSIQLLPIAGFTYIDDGFGTASFSDASQNSNSWNWNFGDGSGTSNLANPSYTYTANGNYTITQVASNSCGNDTAFQTINVIAVNVQYLWQNSAIEVFPNPSSGNFHIRVSTNSFKAFTVSIFNITGELVFSKEYFPNSLTTDIPMDFARLAKGIYQIRLSTNDEIMKSRIAVN